ncbi:MAG TPA: hypothetical protein VMK16_19820 [Acidimicrobiales bacterium]|nr:hypothetical protein [Acidimicrobiales bacterium]
MAAIRETGPSTTKLYLRRKLALKAYRRGFRENQILWRGLWYGLLALQAIRWLRPQPVLMAREVLRPGETVTIRQTSEKLGKRRR